MPTRPHPPYGVHVRNTTGPAAQHNTWGAYVAANRNKARLSQPALAERLGVPRSTIYRWERGETRPRSPEVVQRMAELLRLPLDEALTAAGLRPATDEVAPTPAMRLDPDVMELQRILDDPTTPETTRERIRIMARALRDLAQPTAPQRRQAG